MKSTCDTPSSERRCGSTRTSFGSGAAAGQTTFATSVTLVTPGSSRVYLVRIVLAAVVVRHGGDAVNVAARGVDLAS